MSNNQSPEFEPRVVNYCPLHEGLLKDLEFGEKRMERFENNIDKLLAGQAEQAIAIRELQISINNGIRGDVRRTADAVEELSNKVTQVCGNYDDRIKKNEDKFDKLEDEVSQFRWFREWANRFRDGMIRKFLTMAFYGGLAVTIFYLVEKYLVNR